MLEYDDELHEYRVKGRKLCSVTQAIGLPEALRGVNPAILEAAAEVGRAAHKATELFDLGLLDIEQLPDHILGYVAAWANFKRDTGFVCELIEWRGWHPVYRYAGTLDRVGEWPGFGRTQVDLKTTAVLYPEGGPQTAAYEKLLKDPIAMRGSLQLRGDGTYAWHRWDSRKDWQVFLNMLGVHNWRKQNGR